MHFFLQNYSYKTVPTYDTAGSVKIIKDLEKNNACIASRNAAHIYNMPIIKENIENESNNYTRFLILSKEKIIIIIKKLKKNFFELFSNISKFF